MTAGVGCVDFEGGGGRDDGTLPRMVRRAPLGGRFEDAPCDIGGVELAAAFRDDGSRASVGASSKSGASREPMISVDPLRFDASSIGDESSLGAVSRASDRGSPQTRKTGGRSPEALLEHVVFPVVLDALDQREAVALVELVGAREAP